MTRQSIKEYVEAIRGRYRKAGKEEKKQILDEFTKATKLHRKSAIRIMNRVPEYSRKRKSGCKKRYNAVVTESLKTVWEASDRLCSKRLKPFMSEMVEVLQHHGELQINLETQEQIRQTTTHPYSQYTVLEVQSKFHVRTNGMSN